LAVCKGNLPTATNPATVLATVAFAEGLFATAVYCCCKVWRLGI